jgi:hypothetical protein
MTKPVLIFLCNALLLTAGPSLAQSDSPLRAPLPQFGVHNASIPDALLQAGQQSGVPLGIDASDPKLWKTRVSVRAQNANLGEALGQILAAAPGYTIAQDGRTVVIRRASGPGDLLDTRILEFRSVAGSAGDLSLKLWMTLVLQLSPSRQGFLGFNRTSPLDKLLPASDLSGKTAWEILDWIVGTHGSAAWVAVPFTGELGESSTQRDLWRLEFYPNRPGSSQR